MKDLRDLIEKTQLSQIRYRTELDSATARLHALQVAGCTETEESYWRSQISGFEYLIALAEETVHELTRRRQHIDVLDPQVSHSTDPSYGSITDIIPDLIRTIPPKDA